MKPTFEYRRKPQPSVPDFAAILKAEKEAKFQAAWDKIERLRVLKAAQMRRYRARLKERKL